MTNCIKKTRGDVKCAEKRTKSCFRLKNPSRKLLQKYIIDGCLITDESIKKCDYGILSENRFWLVELKGGDFGDAVDQLISTMQNTNVVPAGAKVVPVIVSTRAPALPKRVKHIRRLKAALGARFDGELVLGTGTKVTSIS